jgi:ABC-type transporter MlaC component
MTAVAAALVASLALPLVEGAAPAPSAALDRSKGVIAAFLKVPAKPGPARDQSFRDLDGYLDLEGMVTNAIAPRKEKLTAAELTRFQKRFRELLRMVAYTDSGDFFRSAKLTWGSPTVKGEDALVPLKVFVPKEDLETELEFRWRQVGGAVRIVDVAFEGDSLTKDYQNQIARIVDKDGGAGLLKALDDKWAEVNGGKK